MRSNENNASAQRLRDSEPEQNPVGALDSGLLRETESGARVVVRIERRSTNLLDPDNLTGSVKSLLDCLRAAKLIHDDDSQSITLSVTQSKVKTRKEAGTFVELIYGNP
jgi:hypothetical protein